MRRAVAIAADMNSQELINSAIDQWCKRLLLLLFVRSQGGHTEHRFCYICDLCLLQTISVTNYIKNVVGILMF